MPIEVHCPNGHKLICPDDFTGTNVKCPRCGVLTEVTARSISRSGILKGVQIVAETNPSDSSVDLDQVADPHEALTVKQKRSPIAAERFSFHCPNGHRLKGPLSLQGRLGQCPHCDVKFRIPHAFEAAADVTREAAREPASTPHLSGVDAPSSVARGETLPSFPAVDEDEPSNAQAESAEPVVPDVEIDPVEVETISPITPAPPPPSRWAEESPDAGTSDHPLARLLATLWGEREHGGVVELHIGDGTVVAPDWWSRSLSNSGYGVFAQENRDGTYHVETIAWENVLRVTVRNIADLPRGQFE